MRQKIFTSTDVAPVIVKQFNVLDRVGKARHVVNYHDGIKTHADGSKFFDMHICGNKRALAKFVAELTSQGYLRK